MSLKNCKQDKFKKINAKIEPLSCLIYQLMPLHNQTHFCTESMPRPILCFAVTHICQTMLDAE